MEAQPFGIWDWVWDKSCGESGNVMGYTRDGEVIVWYDHDGGFDSPIDCGPASDYEPM